MPFTLTAIERAWDFKDPALVDYMVSLAQQKNPDPAQPIRDEALTFPRFLHTIFSHTFRQLPAEEQYNYRIEQLTLLAADNAEVPLPDNLKLHQLILLIYADDSFYARRVVIEMIRTLPLQYGVWKAFKFIYKDSEKKADHQLLGELIARFDYAYANNDASISHATLLYMVRRGWRYLRKLGESLPVCYPDAAASCLAAYPDDTDWSSTWVANHIWHHQSKRYGMARFDTISSNNLLKNRAFIETWQRSPEPLLRLLSTAHAEKVRQYACNALTQNFKFFLRDIDTQWIIQLAALAVESAALDGLLVWLLKNSPKLEQHQFKTLGLHEVVLSLLTSSNNTACQYACQYVSTHGRDMALDLLLQLMNNDASAVRQLAKQLLSEREPRKQVGLDAWGQLLEYKHSHDFASKQLRRHFGRKELSAAWFQQRLLSATYYATRFSKAHLVALHPLKTLGIGYFETILAKLNPEKDDAEQVVDFCLQQLERIGLTVLSASSLQTYLLHPLTRDTVQEWIDNDQIKANRLPIDFYQALAYEPSWDQHPFLQDLLQSDKTWAQALRFVGDEGYYSLGSVARRWLSDVRRFNPADLGFAWLMQLVGRVEEHYHQFAVDIMLKAFVPADFAQQQNTNTKTTTPKPTDTKPAAEINVDLAQQNFVFTGKLKTMTRKQAQAKVIAANGRNVSAVNGKLNYLVIGDEGSPFYSDGKKGSKQLKAEALMAKVDTLKVISETAFLLMLNGETPEFSNDDALAGCHILWAMATEQIDTPVGKFALTYLRHHHADLGLKLTSRPVDPHTVLPEDFITFEQFETLFIHAHTPLRHFALSIAKWEFARWQPASAQLMALCESKYADVRDFIHDALLAEPNDDNKRYRLSAETLAVSAVYQFCNSKKAQTRQLGMQLIQQHEVFQQPDALFQLTESADREIRGFVVRILWSLYRRYATTPHWQPYVPVITKGTKALQKQQLAQQQKQGKGLPKRPVDLPADKAALQQLLQRWLYELPPDGFAHQAMSKGLKPLSACLAKKALIETFRDLALEDDAFAQMILPLLHNFTQSRGAMEQAACLVAVTRIEHSHPTLAAQGA